MVQLVVDVATTAVYVRIEIIAFRLVYDSAEYIDVNWFRPVGGQAFSLILAVRSHSREQNHLIQRNWKLILSQPPEFITKDHHISVIGK